MIFKDRVEAGQLLGLGLKRYSDRNDVIVLGRIRGGVPVACQVARLLRAPLDVIVTGRFDAHPCDDRATGAVPSGGVGVMNGSVVRAPGVSPDDIEQSIATQMEQMQLWEPPNRGHEPAPEIEGLTVILVDDGIATGSTIRAAIEALRLQAPAQIVVAAPAVSTDARAMLEPMVDSFVALITPADFRAVGQWYENFDQTTDAEVRHFLAKANAPEPARKPGP